MQSLREVSIYVMHFSRLCVFHIGQITTFPECIYQLHKAINIKNRNVKYFFTHRKIQNLFQFEEEIFFLEMHNFVIAIKLSRNGKFRKKSFEKMQKI